MYIYIYIHIYVCRYMYTTYVVCIGSQQSSVFEGSSVSASASSARRASSATGSTPAGHSIV